MKQFEWSDDYLVAEEAIDGQHRQLFALANDLIQSEKPSPTSGECNAVVPALPGTFRGRGILHEE
ncbi:hypothetical protein NP603_02180 [Methylomonas sp. SURF-1]|uniref:Uncharacterized protein n=1 Tax=Methylomonas aurea TaxID=2952224 RepID=A0ABT1UCN4_9GAMM|nr:hypothetical protein [Methylomonas sp. SURF-1]MCQ8179905.1 hypothetical protein [Methylomonas sp. SURF-1]